MKKLVMIGIGLAVGYYVGKKVRERYDKVKAENEHNKEIVDEFNKVIYDKFVKKDDEVEVVDDVEEELVPEEMTREEVVDEIVDSLNNIKENIDYMDKIYEVYDDIFDTNNEEFEKLFKDLDM